jgi:hypothetical protein
MPKMMMMMIVVKYFPSLRAERERERETLTEKVD